MIKTLSILAVIVVAAQAMPRYLIVPISNVRFVEEPLMHHRVARSAWPQELGPPSGGPAFQIPVNTNDAIGSAR